jgi:stalled ribosome rescue protein Dom34
MIPDSEDDLWYIYNLIIPGDLIKASTFRYNIYIHTRKVQKITQTGSVISDKKHIKITLAIESVDYLTEVNSIISKE